MRENYEGKLVLVVEQVAAMDVRERYRVVLPCHLGLAIEFKETLPPVLEDGNSLNREDMNDTAYAQPEGQTAHDQGTEDYSYAYVC